MSELWGDQDFMTDYGCEQIVGDKKYRLTTKPWYSFTPCTGCAARRRSPLCDALCGKCGDGVWKQMDWTPPPKPRAPIRAVIADRHYVHDENEFGCHRCDAVRDSQDCKILNGTVNGCGNGSWELEFTESAKPKEPTLLEVTGEIIKLWESKADYAEFEAAMAKLKTATEREKELK